MTLVWLLADRSLVQTPSRSPMSRSYGNRGNTSVRVVVYLNIYDLHDANS
jgi:hypothetical protein